MTQRKLFNPYLQLLNLLFVPECDVCRRGGWLAGVSAIYILTVVTFHRVT